jgi:phage gpG-like protein
MPVPDVSVTVDGADALGRAMTKAVDDLEDLTRTNREVAQAAARSSAQRAPVRTGELKRSITGEGSRSAATVRAGAPYAAPVHWGVPSRGMAPNPFILSAMVADEQTFKTLYERRLAELTKDMANST